MEAVTVANLGRFACSVEGEGGGCEAVLTDCAKRQVGEAREGSEKELHVQPTAKTPVQGQARHAMIEEVLFWEVRRVPVIQSGANGISLVQAQFLLDCILRSRGPVSRGRGCRRGTSGVAVARESLWRR